MWDKIYWGFIGICILVILYLVFDILRIKIRNDD
jgi:hypothetical protein